MDVILGCRSTADLLIKAADLAEDYKAAADLAQRNVEAQRRNTIAFKRERDDLYVALAAVCEIGGLDDGGDVIEKAKAALAKVRSDTVQR